MRHLIGALFLLAAAVLSPLAPARAAGGLQVEPARFVLQVKPTGRVGGAIQVTNLGEFPVNPIAMLYDWDLDPQGRFVSRPLGSTPWSLDGWLKFNPRRFALKPNGRQTVRFSVTPPRNATPGERRAVIFLEQRASRTGGASLVTQLGVIVYVAVEPVKRSFGVSLVGVHVGNGGEVAAELSAKATGNAHCRLEGTFVLYDAAGKQICSGAFPQTVVLPGREAVLSGRSKPADFVRDGKFRLHVRISCSGSPKAYSRDFFGVTLN